MSKTLIFSLFLLLISVKKNVAQEFLEKEIKVKDANGSFELGGTFAYPLNKKKYPAVVLMSGSGQTDRDASMFGIKFFKELSDFLVKKGIAVLRFDDRGGNKSGGTKTSNSSMGDLSSDAEQMVTYLKETEKIKNVGLIGHSEGGGLVAKVNQKDLSFIIALAGPTTLGKEVLIKQNIDILDASGLNKADLEKYIALYFRPLCDLSTSKKDSLGFVNEWLKLSEKYNNKENNVPFILAVRTDKGKAGMVEKTMNSKYFQSFLAEDFGKNWEKVKKPALLLFAEKDIQVNAEINAIAAQNMNKKNFTVKTLSSHNHLFQLAKTGKAEEYEKLKKGYSQETLDTILSYIQSLKL